MQVDLESRAEELMTALDVSVVPWLERCVADVVRRHGSEPSPMVLGEVHHAAEQARDGVMAQMELLLRLDIDEQTTTPLAILRAAVVPVTEVLRAAGVPPVPRDDFQRSQFPGDDYDLTPAGFADIDSALVPAAIAWGAAKAFEHKRRHA